MDGDHARFWSKVDKNGGLLPWMETRCWEWTGARDKTGRGKFWIGDKRDNSVTAQRAALILAGRTLRPGSTWARPAATVAASGPDLVVGTLKECQALKGREPCPPGARRRVGHQRRRAVR